MSYIERNEVLAKILESGSFVGPAGQIITVRAHISETQGEMLQRIIAETKPRVSLEVGLAYGVSALFICDALKMVGGERHIVIDSHQMTEVWDGGAGLRNLKAAGYESLIDFYGEESQRALPKLEARGERIDFAFIDGAHTFDHALVDFFYVDRMLEVGGIVAFDDVGFPCIEKVCRFILKNRNYRIHSTLPSTERSKQPALRRLAYSAIKAGSRVSPRLKRFLSPQVVEGRQDLGLDGWCVAFVKEADDTRGYLQHEVGHRDF
jgi:predicted O-methyltransferase YrrM